MDNHDLLQNAIVYLVSAVLLVPLSKRLGLGSVLGYLAAGILIGPHALRLIPTAEDVLHFSEFGVVLLLFLIGLELNPSRLWQMRKPIFGMGGMQVAVSILILAGLLLLFGNRPTFALVGAMGLAMSSTALALQILRERNLLQIPAGQASFAVLLFQDLAVIPMLAILPMIATQTPGDGATVTTPWLGMAKALGAILGVVVLGRYLVRPAFRIIAGTNLREIFTAFSLALVLGIAALMQAAGLSMALGAFLAGVLLADSEFRRELEIDLEPFKGLLMGLFFIAVGMSMRLDLLAIRPLEILFLILCVLAAKAALLWGIGKLFGYTGEESTLFGLSLSQAGEFAFVLFGVASQQGLLEGQEAGLLNIVVALSMATTPFLFMGYEKWILPRLRVQGAQKEYHVESEGNPVILAGFGRVGQVVGRLLHAQKIGVTILEQDPGQIEVVRRFDWKTFYGDVSRLDLLKAAGAEQAKLLILAIDDMEAAQRTIQLVREHFPHLKVLVRAESRIDAYTFINQGVNTVRLTFAPGLEMAEEALKLLGVPSYEAHFNAERFKHYDRIQLFKSAQHMDDIPTLISITRSSREELMRIMQNDDRRRGEIVGDGWG